MAEKLFHRLFGFPWLLKLLPGKYWQNLFYLLTAKKLPLFFRTIYGRLLIHPWKSLDQRSARSSFCPLYFSNTILTCINFFKMLTYFEAELQSRKCTFKSHFSNFLLLYNSTEVNFNTVNYQLQYLGKFVEILVNLCRWIQSSNP